ncbi:hypothetical protein J9303_01105 [Bacillaceae bacterium Marseille-Q3522]|nr:hypothetical protein [Bacillaceae bacterium Marseille-Q3522]
MWIFRKERRAACPSIMQSEFTKREKMLLFSGGLIFILFIAIAAFQYLLPEIQQLKNAEIQKKAEEQLLDAAEKKRTVSASAAPFAEALKIKLPDKPFKEQLLLSIEDAKNATATIVRRIDVLNEATAETPPASAGQQAQDSNGLTLPEGMQQVVLQLEVTSPSYDQYEKFMQILEENERIIRVQEIEFTSPAVIAGEQQDHSISYRLQISAFYIDNDF